MEIVDPAGHVIGYAWLAATHDPSILDAAAWGILDRCQATATPASDHLRLLHQDAV